MNIQANDERIPTRTDRIDALHVLLGQLRGVGWWMSDYRGDSDIDPEAVRHTGLLLERLVGEARQHVRGLEQEPQARTGP